MKNKLQQYFPLIREREEVMEDIRRKKSLSVVFDGWSRQYQEEFLDFCTGVRGVKMLYDSFAKELLNPVTVPERLNELLSLLLGTKIEIMKVLPNESPRIADEASLLEMDIIVRLEDGSIANIEVQKIGYMFPGQRSACYSADLLLRQYKIVRGEKLRDIFSYRDVKTVYTIVFFEKSTPEFHEFSDTYLHYFQQKSNTGLKMELLQKYLFIPLDIFLKKHQNRPIQNRLDAWLTFLGSDKPEDIISVIEKYPDFRVLYEHVYEICQNTEKVMGMFSKELQVLDRNTVRYMMDEMQNEIDLKKEELSRINEELIQMDKQLTQKDEQLNQKDEQLNQKDEQLNQKDEQLNQKDEQLTQKDEQLTQKALQLAEKDRSLQEALKRIEELERQLK